MPFMLLYFIGHQTFEHSELKTESLSRSLS